MQISSQFSSRANIIHGVGAPVFAPTESKLYIDDFNKVFYFPIVASDNSISWASTLDTDRTASYADMNGDNIGLVVTVLASGTFYPVPTGLSSGPLSGWTFLNSTLTCAIAGVYLVNWALSITVANSNEEVEGSVMVNGAVDGTMITHTLLATSTKPQTISGTGVHIFSVGDTAQLCVNEDSGVFNITVQHANLTLVRIA